MVLATVSVGATPYLSNQDLSSINIDATIVDQALAVVALVEVVLVTCSRQL